jgi:type I restriction enzyme S subunit
LRIADVSSGFIDISNVRRGAVSAKDAETYRLVPGDLLFVRVNGAREIVGRCCVVDGSIPNDTIFNDHLIRAQLKPGLFPAFAQLCMSAPVARSIIEEAASTSAGQLTVNQQILDAVDIPDIPFDEQVRIAARLHAQLAAAREARTAVQAQLSEIERLPARLLAQAFGDA